MLQTRTPIGLDVTTQLIAAANNVAFTPVLMNSKVWIPQNTVSSGALNSYLVYTHISDYAQAAVTIAAGDKIYWDNTNSVFTNVASGNTLCGYALEPSPSASGTGIIEFYSFAA
ncbi:MAG: DUF2190 family protein [Rudaea sp.]|nr:DUF2190 family protein [Rudaea sp.]